MAISVFRPGLPGPRCRWDSMAAVRYVKDAAIAGCEGLAPVVFKGPQPKRASDLIWGRMKDKQLANMAGQHTMVELATEKLLPVPAANGLESRTETPQTQRRFRGQEQGARRGDHGLRLAVARSGEGAGGRVPGLGTM